jgi:4-carboxymuconolactone decarboxylase
MPDPCSPPTRNRTAIRAALAGVGLIQVANGLYALFAPHSFYSDFPVGRGWVAALPSYSEHLVRDVGGLFLATAVALLAAAWFMQRRLILVAAGSFLLFSVPHAIYHLLNLGPYSTGDAIANVIGVLAIVFLPAWVLFELRRQTSRPAPSQAGAEAGSGNARIPGVPDRSGGPLVRYAYRESRRRYGQVADPLRIYAHHPRVMMGYAMLEMGAERSHLVDERLKHLAEVRAAMICGCEWCLDFGSSISEAAGVTEDDLRELPTYWSSDRFSELEKAVLDYATGMSRSPVDVPDELFDRLRAELDEAQLVELTNIIALENYRARFNWAFGIEGQGFSEGSYCVRPEPREQVALTGDSVP